MQRMGEERREKEAAGEEVSGVGWGDSEAASSKRWYHIDLMKTLQEWERRCGHGHGARHNRYSSSTAADESKLRLGR